MTNSKFTHKQLEKLIKSNDDDQEEVDGDIFDLLNQITDSKQSSSLSSRGIIFINGEITKESMQMAIKALLTFHLNPDFKDDIQLIINSAGGSCFDGWALIDMMRFCSNRIRTIAMGEICSMATNIFIAGDQRIIAPHTTSMIHHFSWMAAGNYSDLVAQRKAEEMEHYREMRHLIECSKYNTPSDVAKYLLLDQDHWLTPTEMLSHGLCDEIYNYKNLTSKGVYKRLKKVNTYATDRSLSKKPK